MQIAERLSKVAPSATLALAQRAREMAAAGQKVVSFTAGEPDFATPSHITEALKRSVDAGHTRYTAVAGTPDLREAISRKYATRGFEYAIDQILASTGAKQSIYNALMASVNDGQQVVIAAPYWLSYADMVRLAGGTPNIVATDESNGFIMTAEQLEAALKPQTRAVILNSPSNPTGAVYRREDLAGLAEVLKKRPDVLVITDEIYEHLVYAPATFTSILDVAPELSEQTIVINGCSKSYAMTGLRLGWAAGPKPIIAAMTKLQGQCTSNPSAPVQDAAIAALDGDHGPVKEMVRAFDERRRAVVEGLNGLPDVTCFEPQGAFYAFPNVGKYVGRRRPDGSTIENASDVCAHLLERVGVVVVPGAPFGAPQNFRVSFATDRATIDTGLGLIGQALAELG